MPSRKKSSSPPRRKKVEELPIESIVVRLKPVRGIPPRVYTPVLWAVAVVLVFFLLLVLPGLRRNGTWTTVHSLPSDSSVLADQIRLGRSAKPLFVSRGMRTITVRRPGFIPHVEERLVSGRVFASRLFPRREVMEVALKPQPGFKPMAAGLADFAAWSGTGSREGRYAIPPSLSVAARDALAMGGDSPARLAEAALPLCRDERHLADAARSTFLLESNGAPPGAVSIGKYLHFLGEMAAEKPELIHGVLQTMDSERRTEWKLNDVLAAKTSAAPAYPGTVEGTEMESHGGIPFAAIPGSLMKIGDVEVREAGYRSRYGAEPVAARVDSFLIAAREISNREFARFVAENPQWSVNNRDALIASSQADADYLRFWTAEGPEPETASLPVTDISWYAARAYARWFTQEFLSGSVARLPREDEWEIAARLNGVVENSDELGSEIRPVSDADEGRLGLRGMGGNVREWTLNPFRFNENLYRPAKGEPAYMDPDHPLSTPERPVRGAAFIDRSLPYPISLRGSLPAHRSSPVVGFRLVISSTKP